MDIHLSDGMQQAPSQDIVVKVNLDNFIGMFDGAFSKQFCENLIAHFEKVKSVGDSYCRSVLTNREAHIASDENVDFVNYGFHVQDELQVESSEFLKIFWDTCYPIYVKKYSVLREYGQHKIFSVKIQKTEVGGGYHIWHSEDSVRETSNRIMAFIVYLNDVNEGGETEFLYIGKRVSAAQGRLVIFPAAYTHTHRGNPPLSGEKYILTGWIEL